jgi:hypothetical protein
LKHEFNIIFFVACCSMWSIGHPWYTVSLQFLDL